MTVFIQTNATGGGAGTLNAAQGQVDLGTAVGGDTGFGVGAAIGNRQPVTYIPTLAGATMTRVDTLINTAFSPDYGQGAGPQAVPIVVLPVGANFTLNDGTLITNVGGTALPPSNSALAGATLNNTTDCLVIYDTSDANGDGYCTARAGTGGTLDLPVPTSIMLYHELSHAFRIVNNTLLALTAACNPSSPEERAAITDENDLRTLNANAAGVPVVLRDRGIHCGRAGSGGSCPAPCCIIASVASGSPVSDEVKALRFVRDRMVRHTEMGFAFFQRFFHDYYAFSPQVCTMMARRPELSKLVLEGFVRPLVVALRLLQHYAVDECTDTALGERLAHYHPDRNEAETTLATLSRAQAFWRGSVPSDDACLGELAVLLQTRAWPSEHIRWSLIDPLRFYSEALQAYAEGRRPAALGRMLRQAFTTWAAEVPLDHLWGSLSAAQLRKELGFFEGMLLRPTKARQRFRRRLLEQFGGVTAIEKVLGPAVSSTGGIT